MGIMVSMSNTTGRHHSDELAHRRRAAAARWAGATSGDAPCTLDQAGTAPYAAKYHEGEVAALGEAMRAVVDAGPREAIPLVRAARDRWAHRAVSLTASPSPAWRAYHEGGRDALAAFLEAAQRDARS